MFHGCVIVHYLRELVGRNEQLFPGDRRLITNVDVFDEGDSVHVFVASAI